MKFSRLAIAAAISGGIVLSAQAVPASATDSATDRGVAAYPGAAPWHWHSSGGLTPGGGWGAFAPWSASFKTAALPEDRRAPLKRFRVGPLYGAVGGPHTGGVHSGLDIGARQGTPIYAISDGKVVVSDWQGAAGQAVTIRTSDRKLILYAHMSKLIAKRGQKVQAGDLIGRVGSTGNSTGPHLHLGVTRPNGSMMDPLKWLDLTSRELRQIGRG
ncbi:MAG: M23 family metallopeptidase [Candidatus Nanopelagicales bacterium]|nr:M23 family metallopeptidase [Candidatus Nanopelagicales bacterium]MDZ4249749.1 M23 family metallopeptidase [Candidatus Nanopelagicales bacterium]MDZ7578322.1 M23 family metallopeptidase [Candidatus Nanopelagicales bacterium]